MEWIKYNEGLIRHVFKRADKNGKEEDYEKAGNSLTPEEFNVLVNRLSLVMTYTPGLLDALVDLKSQGTIQDYTVA